MKFVFQVILTDKKSKWLKFWQGEIVHPVVEADLVEDPVEAIDCKVDPLDHHPGEVGAIEEVGKGLHQDGVHLQDVDHRRDVDHLDVLQGDHRDDPDLHHRAGGLRVHVDPHQDVVVGIPAPVPLHQVRVRFVGKQKMCTKIVKYRILFDFSRKSFLRSFYLCSEPKFVNLPEHTVWYLDHFAADLLSNFPTIFGQF